MVFANSRFVKMQSVGKTIFSFYYFKQERFYITGITRCIRNKNSILKAGSRTTKIILFLICKSYCYNIGTPCYYYLIKLKGVGL
jgi:hypothetical protein